MRYIIKNCPSITSHSGEDKWTSATCIRYGFCQDTVCLLKQIVAKCKGQHRIIDGNPEYSGFVELGIEMCKKEILDLLEIEECENE